jgi:hypothetical protein
MATLSQLVRRGTLALLALVAWRAPAAVPPSAAEVKAVFLYNFTGFVEWPADSFPSRDSPLVIGVCGDYEMVQLVREAVRGERVRGHPIDVTPITQTAQLARCHVVYVAAGREWILDRAPPRHGVLTIGETEEFFRCGGIIRFLPDRNRIKLQVNLPAARAATLAISSQLLRIAETLGADE